MESGGEYAPVSFLEVEIKSGFPNERRKSFVGAVLGRRLGVGQGTLNP
jgi:hypothetical protein